MVFASQPEASPMLFAALHVGAASNNFTRLLMDFMPDVRLVAYSISVELKELVTLARGFKTYGAIWDTGTPGAVGQIMYAE